MEYKEPNMEVIEFQKHDVVCVSGLKGNESGDGGSDSINGWL